MHQPSNPLNPPSLDRTDLSGFFDRNTPEELQQLIQTLEQQPGLKEMEREAPPDLKQALEQATPEFLAGYLVGTRHAAMALYSSAKAASQGDEHVAEVIRQRQELLTLMICRRLTNTQSRLILLH